jgi:DMSO/TMAO reductase YedYZ molybdopterin-dependent catalytic subunit
MRLPPAVERGVPAGVAAVAASYAYAGFTREFVVAPVSRVFVRYTPDALVTAAITGLGSLAQTLVLAGAVVATTALFVAVGTAAASVGGRAGSEWIGGRVDSEWVGVPVGGVLAGVLGATLVGTWEVGVVTGLAVAATLTAFAVPLPFGSAPGAPRRRVLRAAAGVAASAGVGSLLAAERTYAPESTVRDPVAVDMLAAADERSFALSNAEPLVSRGFYEVDINAIDPRVDRESWTLSVSGTASASYDLDALRSFDTEHRFVTLRCVGDPRNGYKMDTALWMGVPVQAILDDAGAPADCCVVAHGADDYYNEFPQAALEDALLAFRMNGTALPRGHGAPVRLLVPGHWGEINVKWLTELELTTEAVEGYWEKRGWHGTGPVNTVAKLHHRERDGDQVSVGGHAYAGTRGISAVEVSTDGGETWSDARISDPLPGAREADGPQRREFARDAWRHWHYEFTASDPREVVVRAIEADGTVQPRERTDAHPRGASGWVTQRV